MDLLYETDLQEPNGQSSKSCLLYRIELWVLSSRVVCAENQLSGQMEEIAGDSWSKMAASFVRPQPAEASFSGYVRCMARSLALLIRIAPMEQSTTTRWQQQVNFFTPACTLSHFSGPENDKMSDTLINYTVLDRVQYTCDKHAY